MAFIAPLLIPRLRPTSYRPRCNRCSTTATLAQPPSDPPPSSPDPEPETTTAATPSTSSSSSSSTPQSDAFEQFFTTLQTTIDQSYDNIFSKLLPLFPPLRRSWKYQSPNFVLYPTTPPKAVIHFLGGAFFAAAPHILYHTFLTRLCEKGYIIVATPYNLSFDYLPVAESICDAWETIESDLAANYGPLPVIGLGHSAGGLFHAIISSLFPDSVSKAANIYVSFSNRKAESAIPMFRNLVAPTVQQLVTFRNGLPASVRASLDDLPLQVDKFLDDLPLSPQKYRNIVLPTFREARKFVEQLPPLLDEIGNGAKEFYPTPDDVQSSVEKYYSVEQTLLVMFENDQLDDTPALVEALKRAKTEHSLVTLQGTHVTPLSQQTDLEGVGAVVGDLLLNVRELERLIRVIEDWVESGLESDKL